MGVSISTEDDSWYIPIGHDSWMDPNGQNLEVPEKLLTCIRTELVFHNAKFDIHVLKRAGFIIPEIKIYDTMLMSHLIYEDRFSHSLEALASDYLGVHKEKDLAKTMKAAEWNQMPAFAMAKYAEQDAKLTYDLYYTLKPHFEPYEKVWEIDERFMLLLQRIEELGIILDVDKCRELQSQSILSLQQMRDSFGFDPSKPSQLHKKLFDNPPNGLGLRVTHKTPTGKPQVNTDFLSQTDHPICKEILKYRELSKQLSSYYNSYLELTGESYNRIHPSFKQHGTVTGRLSCADPNMQQIPRESPIKGLFLPEIGKQLWEIDYRNIEMRLAAVYSQEDILLETFREEGDVHGITAKELGITRQHAKIINFLIIYGGSEVALQKQLHISYSEAKNILTKYRKLYRKLFATMQACKEVAEETGKIRMWSGRERHFRYKSEANKAFNSIIQGGSFEIVKRSMLDMAPYFDIRNQVHDSVWILVDDESEVRKAEHVMADWTEEAFGLKFSVESKQLG